MSERRHDKHKNGKPAKKDRNEGEGNRTAAHDYNDGLQSFIAGNRVEPAAREAKQYVEAHPQAAADAEDKAAEGPAPVRRRVEELMLEGRAIASRIVSRVRSVTHRRAK